jgi:hypothetical protein
MKIKKQMTVKAPGGNASGGATIADRFKIEPAANKSSSGGASSTATKVAFFAGFLALCAVGGLAWFAYQHAEFFKSVMDK